MAGEDRVLAGGARYIDFQTEPSRYRHWKLAVEGDVATLTMDVDENGGLFEGYQLKLNSYDLGYDIELADVVQRLRFEHPGVKAVVVRSAKNRVFCAGANIRMLAGATHAHKVNFCKFTNETRNGLEDSSENSGQRFITVVNGTAAGGGFAAQRQRKRHCADTADAQLRRKRDPLWHGECRYRSWPAHRDHFDQGAGGASACRHRRHDRARRVVLAAASRARTRRRHPAF